MCFWRQKLTLRNWSVKITKPLHIYANFTGNTSIEKMRVSKSSILHTAHYTVKLDGNLNSGPVSLKLITK